MKKLIGLLFGCIFTITALAADYSPARQSVHRIYTQNGSNGSGVMIYPKLMLTAAHVAIIPNLMVNGKPVMKVIKRDDNKDIALLLVDENCPCAELSPEFPQLDDDVIAIGFPLHYLIKTQILTKGQYQGYIEKENRFMVTTPIAPGNSGGGLFIEKNGKFYLIGIMVEVSGFNNELGIGLPVFHLARAVDIQTIIEFLR